MRRETERHEQRWALALGALLGLSACQSPGSQRIVGPDGTAMAHVHCGAEQGVCFRIAGELCPSGYEIQPVLSGSDGNFLVRCRVPGPPAAPAALAAPCPTVERPAPASAPVLASAPSPRAPEREQRWPPSAEPAPATYPWPPPATSTAVRGQPSSPAAQGELDLGY